MRNLTGKTIQIERANGETQTATAIRCTTNNQRNLETINDIANNHQHLWEVRLENGSTDLWSEKRIKEVA